MIKAFLVCLMYISPFVAGGQTVLNEGTNEKRNFDKIYYQSVFFTTPGKSGENVIWDFSSIETKDDGIYKYVVDSCKRIHQYVDQEKNSYVLRDNLLSQYKYENRLAKIKYVKQKNVLRYPLQYGDSIISNFLGYGQYCDDHIVKVKGQVLTQVDGVGKLVLSENDTIYNVYRVFTITSTSLAMDIDKTNFDSTQLKQEIEEKYEWYSDSFRYPIYSVVQRTSFSNLEQVGSKQYAYRLLPEGIDELSNILNDSLNSNNLSSENENIPEKFHYKVECSNGEIKIIYSSDDDATVKAIVSNPYGVIFRQQNKIVKAGESGNIMISTNGLVPDLYVLYLNVNGRISSKTINIR